MLAKAGRAAAYEKAKDRALRHSAEITLVGQDISPLPPIRNPARRQQAERVFGSCSSRP